MPNMTLAIPAELKKIMDRYKEINWSEVARKAIKEKTLILQTMDQLLSKSKLTEGDIAHHAKIVNKRVLRKHKGI